MDGRRTWALAGLCAALVCGDALAQPGPTQAALNDAGRSTDWLHVNHDYAGQRFVDVDLIDRGNVADLAPVCHFELDFKRAFYTAPLVHRGVIYVTTTRQTIALDAATCELRWHHQAVPHDIHDWDLTQASPLFSIEIDGRPRDLVVSVGKEGVLRALDRDTGVLVYDVPVTTLKNVDKALTHEGVHACPGVLGGVQWNGPAYHPGLDLLVVPSVDWCGTYNKHLDAIYRPGEPYMGGGFRHDPVDAARGWLVAIDAGTGAIRWRYGADAPMVAGATATAAGLVFAGDLGGHVLALDARDGTVLYRHDLGAPLAGGVVTYAAGGRQYLAVVSGTATRFWRVPVRPARVTVFALK